MPPPPMSPTSVGGGTGGARSLYSEGTALLATTATVIEKGKQAAGEVLEAAAADIEFESGRFAIAGTDRGVGILDLARTQAEKAARAVALRRTEFAQPLPAPRTSP